MGLRPPDAGDRRVQRTRRTLREALVALIHERGWEGFSVQDVCDRADVGRSTFYTHFADKEELLVSGFDDFRAALRQQLARSPAPGRPLGFARGLIDHACENVQLFRAMVGKRSHQLVLRRFRELVLGLVREDLQGLGAPAPLQAAAERFIAGGFLELLTWQLEGRRSPDPEALERLFLQVATPIVEGVRRASTRASAPAPPG